MTLPYPTSRDRRSIRQHQEYRCAYCAAKCVPVYNLTYDHVVPRSIGGPNEPRNMVLCCRECNTAKGSDTSEHWMAVAVRVLFERGEPLEWMDEFGIPWHRYVPTH